MLNRRLHLLCDRGVVPKEGHKVVAYLCFTVTVRTSKLKLFPYSQKQNKLCKKIKSLRRKGLTFSQIAESFRENKITTIRGKVLYANHVYSIIKYDKKRKAIMKKLDKLVYGKSNLRIIDNIAFYNKNNNLIG